MYCLFYVQPALIIKSATDQENSDYISCHSCCTKNSEIQGKVTRFLNLWPGFKSNKLHFEITSCEQYIKQMVLHYRLKYIKLEGSFCQPICEVRDLNDIQILFMATKQKLWTNLRAVSTSSVSGYVSSPGYPFSPTPLGMNASHTIYLPEGHTMLLSFADVRFNGAKSILKILERREHETVTIYWWRHRKYKDRILMINTSIVVSFTSGYRCVGFKLQFSFHPYNTLPHRLKGHIFNCSVLHYASFKQHLECNLEKECQAGEDEGGHCPFSSEACRGHVNVADKKCYVLYVSKKPLSWLGNQAVCREKGGDMAIVRLKEEMDALLEMLRAAVQSFYVNVGLIVSDGVPNIYRHTPMWIDNTVAYTTPYITSWPYSSNLVHQVTLNVHSLSLEVQNILNDRTGPYLCEHAIQNQSSDPRPVATVTDKVTFNYSKNTTDEKTLQGLLPPLMVCPAGHRTHDFLKCDREAYCLQKQYKLLKCPVSIKSRNTMHTMDNRQKQRSHVFTVAMFQCDRVAQTVPYTLVCNGLPDCLDRSDETFCRHLPCLYYEHRCDNGQCVDVRLRSNIRCDRVTDCYDGSDEAVCPVDNSRGYSTVTVSPPARIDHTHDYFPAATPLESPHTCPQSHFSCPGAFGYCLPIYVRCNSYYDCPNHEDEMGCENYMCPGLYRCRGSIVCLHITHLCDGVVQCQDQDDEVLCEFSCPHNCLCQGLSFLCPNPFPAANFPRLRYLDAAHSSITFHLLQWNSHLVWLSLRDCRLREVSNNTFVNLQYLDLSQNMIEVVTVVFLETLENLKEIRLSENPLVSIIPETFAQCHSGLQRIDLSETRLGKFDCNVFSNFRDVVFLNLSHCDKLSLANIGFQCFPFLKEIDVRGTHILQSKQSMFEGLRVIEFIFSDNYRHCCASVLPKVSRNLFCVVPLTGYSSCSYLLRFSLHRVFLFLSALLSLLGSMFSLLGHHLQGQQHSSSRSTEVFIINLILAVLLTEIYQWIIISGDIRFHGNFLPHERDWTLSASCKTAYFAAFVSTEASCFTCLWISVDRLTALRFPSKRLHFRSACMVCLVVWLTALCLGTAPVLSTASTGNVGTYTSLCIPVALMGDKSGDHAYASGVLVVLNSITALVSAICLTLVYYHVRSHYVIATSSQTSQDMVIARRVMAVVLSDVIYWLGIGFLGIISCIAPSTALSDVMTSMFVVGVPLKSVVSPLLYLNGLVSERRRMAAESRLLLLLERRLRSPPVRGQPSAPQAPLTVRQETSTRSQLMGRLQSKPSSAHKQSQQTVQERQAQRRVDEALSPAQGRKTPSRVESSSVTQPGKSARGGHIRLPFWEGATSQSARQSGTGSSGFWPPCTSEVEVLGFLKQCLQSDALQTDDVKEMLENLQRQDPPHMRDKLKGNTLQAVDEKDDV